MVLYRALCCTQCVMGVECGSGIGECWTWVMAYVGIHVESGLLVFSLVGDSSVLGM